MYLWEAASLVASRRRSASHINGQHRIRPSEQDVVYEKLEEQQGDWFKVDKEEARKTWPPTGWFVGRKPRR